MADSPKEGEGMPCLHLGAALLLVALPDSHALAQGDHQLVGFLVGHAQPRGQLVLGNTLTPCTMSSSPLEQTRDMIHWTLKVPA